MPFQYQLKLANLGPSLSQFAQEEQAQCVAIPIAIPPILHAIALAGKMVNQKIKAEIFAKRMDARGTFNVSGDEQKELDIVAHNSFVGVLRNVVEVCAIISEEMAKVELNIQGGEYIVALDPLDGSDNVSVNIPMGTIFAVYRRNSLPVDPIQPADILQPGKQQIAAGYILYSLCMMLVYATVHGVHGFTYEPVMDDFFLTHPAMQFPKQGKTYAINDSYQDSFPSYVQRYVQYCRSQQLGARYTGALVADFHRHLLQGGIYLYPPNVKSSAGKLRLMFECNALAFIAEQAGGMASNGKQAVLHIVPTMIHQCIPFYTGNKHMVRDLLAFAS